MASATGFGLAALFGFSGTECGIFILRCVMPVSVATYLFLELYTPEQVPYAASLILTSTLLTVLVLPVVLTYGL